MADPISPSDSLSFQSNKIGGPPNSASNISNNASTPSFPFDNTTRSIPNSKFSLKILSPSAKNKKNSSLLEQPTLSFGSSLDELAATPKTRGITRLKKTSTQYTNQEFTKRLSIPSFHVADQILMDLLTEQNNTAMNTIDEDEIDDEDNGMDILDFMDDEEDDDDDANEDDDDDNYDQDEDEDDDDDLDSLMTLNAFPDLPDFGSAQSNGSETTINSMGQISTTPPPRNKTLIPTTNIITQSSSTGTPNVQLSDLGSEEFRGFDENQEDDFDDPPQPKINTDANVVVEDDDEDEMLTPTTYQNLFKSFHKHDMEQEIQRQQQQQIEKEQAREHALQQQEDDDENINIPTPNSLEDKSFGYNMDDDKKEEDNYNNYGHSAQYSLSSRIGMKINVSQFKSDDEPSMSVDGYDGLGPTGFSGLQHSTSLRFTNTIRKSRTYSEEESRTIINNDGMGNTNTLRMQSKQKKLTAAESAILVAKELLETEIQYQDHLKNLQRILLGPIIKTYFGNDCISSVFYKFLCEIISVSKSFTMRLSIYVKALQIPQLANWIYFCCKRFGVYAHYAKMYDIFLDRLTLCKDIDDNIEFWIKRQEKKYKEKLNN